MRTVLFILILQIQILLANPTTHTRFKHYFIYPHTKAEISTLLHDESPIYQDGKIYHGSTRWDIRYNYKYRKIGNQCKIYKADVTLDIIYTMPKLLYPEQIEKNIRNTFKNYYNALFKHERNHMKYAENAARETEQFLLHYKGRCNSIKYDIRKKTTKIFNNCKKINRNYDQRTGHGRTEGVNVSNFF